MEEEIGIGYGPEEWKPVVDKKWLEDVLNLDGSNKIGAFQVTEKDEDFGQGYLSSYIKVHIDYESSESCERFPSSLFIKYPKQFTGNELLEYLVNGFKIYLREALFYKMLAKEFHFVPKPFGNMEIHPFTYITLENVLTQGRKNVSNLVVGYDYNQMVSIVTMLAKFHAYSASLEPSYKRSINDQLSQCQGFSSGMIETICKLLPTLKQHTFHKLLQMTSHPRAPLLLPSFTSTLELSLEEERSLLEKAWNETKCKTEILNEMYIHGDLWAGNILHIVQGQKEEFYMIDWQFFGIGSGLNDFVFLIYSSLQSACFGKIEELLMVYYKALRENGLELDDWDLFCCDFYRSRIFGFVPLIASTTDFLNFTKDPKGQNEIDLRLALAVRHYYMTQQEAKNDSWAQND
eukprot:TRINITY_DN12574_c0_g1_i1.p1 TRINITY_DN12574_c0_g1~~TRINITY_DN12574_c0_g1_i1.p1  ORF type:complete len:404 (-),score=114.63 TRINITY_DN12574_c0_g1_i1:22-1233(-)